MKGDISNLERFVLLVIFAILVIAYSIKDIFTADINPFIKLAPFFGLLAYLLLRDKFNKK